MQIERKIIRIFRKVFKYKKKGSRRKRNFTPPASLESVNGISSPIAQFPTSIEEKHSPNPKAGRGESRAKTKGGPYLERAEVDVVQGAVDGRRQLVGQLVRHDSRPPSEARRRVGGARDRKAPGGESRAPATRATRATRATQSRRLRLGRGAVAFPGGRTRAGRSAATWTPRLTSSRGTRAAAHHAP